MDRIAKLIEESQSGPGLFVNVEDSLITLGAHYALIAEIGDALDGARENLARIEPYDLDACSPWLMAVLALEHAHKALQTLYSFADVDGNIFWSKDKKITFTRPDIIMTTNRAKPEKRKREQ